jgi:hypothetical protein
MVLDIGAPFGLELGEFVVLALPRREAARLLRMLHHSGAARGVMKPEPDGGLWIVVIRGDRANLAGALLLPITDGGRA